MKAEARLAVKREHRTEILYEINKKLLATRGLDRIVALTNDYVVKLFGRSIIFFTTDPEHGEDGEVGQALMTSVLLF
uniref:hypothetical protein n=1 Tax=Clostridium sp. NkU-1 TaxID=1095009 RepID=UPI0032608CF0